VKDLMLCPELISDIKKGMFHIYSFSRIEEGFELIMNKKPGQLNEKGEYTEGSVYQILSEKLEELSKANKDSVKEKSRKSAKKKKIK
jgi:hypothetical protein